MFNGIGCLICDFPAAFLRPGGTVKLYSSVPVELYTTFSDLKNLAKNLGQKSDQKSSQHLVKVWPKSVQNLNKV